MMSSLQNVILAKHHTKRLSPKPQKYWRSKIIAVLFCNAKYFRLSAKWIFKERIMTIYGTLCDRETKLIIHWPDKWQYKTPWGILMDFYRLPRGYLFINSMDLYAVLIQNRFDGNCKAEVPLTVGMTLFKFLSIFNCFNGCELNNMKLIIFSI